MKRRIAALAAALATAGVVALVPEAANASWTGPDGAACRDTLFNNNLDVCGVSRQSEGLPWGTVGWDAYSYLPNQGTYVSLWRYYGPGNASFTGRSVQLTSGNEYLAWHLGEFNTGDCAQYLIGIGYWQGGTWHGTWQSPPVWSC